MITQFYGDEVIQSVTKSSNTVITLPSGSKIKLGGVGSYLNNPLSLDTSIIGVGGLESAIAINTLYYVYVVLDGITEKLIGSVSSVSPLGFNSYRKVGAFYIDNNSNILLAYKFGSDISFDQIDISSQLAITDDTGTNVKSPTTALEKMLVSRSGSVMSVHWTYYHQTVTGIAGTGVYGVTIPLGLSASSKGVSGGNSPNPRGLMRSDIGGANLRSWTAFADNSVIPRIGYMEIYAGASNYWRSTLNEMSLTYVGLSGNFEIEIAEWVGQKLDWNQY